MERAGKNVKLGRAMMHPVRRRKLFKLLFIAVILTIVISLLLFALRKNISLFFSPTQIMHGEGRNHNIIRLGGKVVAGSIKHFADLNIQFKLTDFKHTITVNYRGILPDLFREGQGIIATGKLDLNNNLQATTILAKHDANYMPPEVKDLLLASS